MQTSLWTNLSTEHTGQNAVFAILHLPPPLGPTQTPIQWLPGALSPGIKRPRCEADHETPSKAEVKIE